MIETKPFPFSGEFKTKILALMLLDRSFIAKKRHILSHKYFENPAYVTICKEMLDFYDKYGVAPTEESLNQLVENREDSRLIKAVVKKMVHADLSDSEFVQDEVVDFCTQQAMRIALFRSEEYLKDKKYDKILPMIEKALLSGESNVLDGFKLSESMEIVKDYLSEKAQDITKIPTLITGVDRILGGGAKRGDINMFVAPTKKGKSIILNNISFGGAMQGYKVAHVSVEMNNEANAVRSHMRLSGMTDDTMLGKQGKWLRSFKRLMSRGGDIYYKHFPTKQLTVPVLKEFLIKLQRLENFSTDLLVVDYIDLLKPSGNYDSPWAGQGEVVEDLRGLATEMNLACWTATQGKKDSGDKATLNEADIRGSAEKAFTVDSLWAILRSEAEMESDPPIGRLQNILLREGQGMGKVVNVIFDPSRMLVTNLDEIPF